MPRKQSITLHQINDAAFALVKESGIAQLTARKLAAKAGCSTQPIFRVYPNMEECKKTVYLRAIEAYEQFYDQFPKRQNVAFVNLGLAYIRFAATEKNLFDLLFLNAERKALGQGKGFYEILNGSQGNVIWEIQKARVDGCKNPEQMFMKMWIFIHGVACMTITGDYDLDTQETITLLEESYRAFLRE
ncbi:MAG: TetR/AcrR family transcriptional regulator [Lachnospiraceae bacterium]|nr:TetR/AcrR family transcriptional regulator [Lachnospiraceae bacterium]